MGTPSTGEIALIRAGRNCRAVSFFGVVALVAMALLAVSGPAAAADLNPVTEWVSIVQPAIHNPAEPRPPGSSEVIHTIVHLAVYDAVVAIEGGYEPYHASITAPPGADVGAAVATAAHRTARGRVAPSQVAYLDEKYRGYMGGIPDGRAKNAGVAVGEAAAAGLLTRRADDHFGNAVAYQCSANPLPIGEFEPNSGCGTEPVDAKMAQVKPFTFDRPDQFRPDGPDPLSSEQSVTDFNEVKEYGRKDSAVRTPEQTDIVYFWSEHGYVHWNRNLNSLATARGLGVRDTARLFAMAHTAAADASIAGMEAKYHYRAWRPRTAVPRAAEDGNPDTDADPTWAPLLSVNHPEYPSAHAFFSTALSEAVAAFFGTNQLAWTLETDKTAVPSLVQTRRTYQGNAALMADIDNARIWAGLHYRNSMNEGRALGARVARHVTTNYFRPRTPAPLAQLPRTGNSPLWFLVTLGLGLASTGALTRAVSSHRRL
jgi:hypothetical protein